MRAAPIALLPFVMACGGTDSDASGFVLTIDSAGVAHAANRGDGAWSAEEAWRIDAPHIRIGRVEGTGPDVFGRIADVAVGPDGDVYVLDWQAKDVRVFSPNGEFVDRFGGPGRGPGEFEWPDAIATTPDGNIAVRDVRLYRATLFSPDAEYVRDFRLSRPYPMASFGEGFWIDGEGRFHDRLSVSLRIDSPDSLAVARYWNDGTPIDTLIVAETARSFVTVSADGRAHGGLPIPFAPVPVLAVLDNGTIARALGVDYRIDLINDDGDVVRAITRDVEPATIGDSERDALLADLHETAKEFVDGGTLEEGFTLPAKKPAVTHMLTDASGNLWVAAMAVPPRFEPPSPFPEAFDVFDAEGRFLGTVAASFRITEIGTDYVAGIADDSLGVSYAVVSRLTKQGG